MPPRQSRRSERGKEAVERATEESTEGAAITSYAEDAAEDSVGPGPDRDRAHGSSGVHKDSDKLSTGNPPSTPVSTRSDAVVHRAMAAGGGKGSGRRQFPGSARLNTTGDAPSKHDNPLGNTTPSSSPLGNESRGGPHTAGSDGEPKGTSGREERPRERRSLATEHPHQVQEALAAGQAREDRLVLGNALR